jgi:RND superfamily putative drug exporter
MLARLARFLHAHGRSVLLVAVLGAVVAGAFGFGVGKQLSPYGATDPATQSVQATNRFQSAAGRQIDAGVVALVDSGNVRTAAARQRVSEVAAELRLQPDVARVVSFYDSHNPVMVSRDGSSTYVLAYFRPLSDKALKDVAGQIEQHFAGQHDVTLGGAAIANAQVNTQVGHDLAHAELLAFPFIFLLSLLFFRSLLAALLPPLLGGLAIVATFFALRVISGFVDLSVFALNFVTGMGLGLAIDYSLFMVSRYREEAASSGFGAQALTRTLQTAGRTIIFSSLTIAAAVASLAVFPQRFLYSMGIAGAVAALLSATLALTVLPALLTVLGPRVNAFAPKRLQRAAEREARPDHHGFWYRLSRLVMRRPALIAASSAAIRRGHRSRPRAAKLCSAGTGS